MVTGLERWLLGYTGTRLTDRVLELIRGNPLINDLHKAIETWASALPAGSSLASPNALFPSHVLDSELTDRPCLASLRADLKISQIPTKNCWYNALIEQWRYIVTHIPNPQEFFTISEDLASKHINDLAAQLCRVCSQHSPFFQATTITLLRAMEEKLNDLTRVVNVSVYNESAIPTELIDPIIEEEVEKLKKARRYLEFERTSSAVNLGTRLTEGNLSGGSDGTRSKGLAWCARIAATGSLGQAESFLELAKKLGSSPETKIAEASICSEKKDKASALRLLAGMDLHASRSAALMIVTHNDGPEAALKWMDAANYTVDSLDSDGKNFLLHIHLLQKDWNGAAHVVESLTEADFEDTPLLHHFAAIAILASAVPVELRETLLAHVPFESQAFPLASTDSAMNARRMAHKHFLDSCEAAKKLACPRAARIDDEYALWLELLDSAQKDSAKKRLEEKLNNPNTKLGFVRYAFDFGIALDLDAVEREIDRNVVINGGPTIEAAIARFSLALIQPTPEKAANYIIRHQDQIAAHIDAGYVQSRLIELYAHAGLIERANEAFGKILEEKSIPAEQEERLQRVLSVAQGSDPIESRKAQYEKTKALNDLINLVAELESLQRWDDLCVYAKRLFEQTDSHIHANCLVNALSKMGRQKDLVGFLKTHPDQVAQSTNLRMTYAWGLYYEGDLVESRAVLAGISDVAGTQNYRALYVNLGIATGDWDSLSSYIADEYRNRNNRSARELIDTAKLALHLGASHVKDFVFEAVKKGDDDAIVLANAYFIATSAGWEDDPQIAQWIEKAADLSGEDGPLRRVSLQDIIEQKPNWDRRESETWRLLEQGQIPIFLASQSLNRTLVDLMTFPALANPTRTDPRRRLPVPAYSGNRLPLELGADKKTAAFDASALLTLSFLDLLDVALDYFQIVYIPHSTLRWLFEERQKASFHQPSRIANAHEVRNLLAKDMLERFNPRTVANSELSILVGDELAALIAEAAKASDEDENQHIVVRSAPVFGVSSLMREEVDLSVHAPLLSDCLSVVKKLRQKGQITAEEERRARAYLQLHEKPWPNQPDIADGATLYLDDLAVSFLQHLDLLGKLKAAGLTAVVSPRELSEEEALISYESISNDVKNIIERLRDSLATRIESGRVRVGGRRNSDECEDGVDLDHPSADTIHLASVCDMAIIDDRFANQHALIDNGGTLTPIRSTLDLLDSLFETAAISYDDYFEYRTKLLRAGYLFVPIRIEELERFLGESTVSKGVIAETAELKAIRESVLQVRMSNWLQFPKERPWLDEILITFVHVLRHQWVDGANIEEAIARSNWLVEQVDIRGWAHRLEPELADNVVRLGRASGILLLLVRPINAQDNIVDAYWTWVEEWVLAPLKEQFPEVYNQLLIWYRNQFVKMMEEPPSLEVAK